MFNQDQIEFLKEKVSNVQNKSELYRNLNTNQFSYATLYATLEKLSQPNLSLTKKQKLALQSMINYYNSEGSGKSHIIEPIDTDIKEVEDAEKVTPRRKLPNAKERSLPAYGRRKMRVKITEAITKTPTNVEIIHDLKERLVSKKTFENKKVIVVVSYRFVVGETNLQLDVNLPADFVVLVVCQKQYVAEHSQAIYNAKATKTHCILEIPDIYGVAYPRDYVLSFFTSLKESGINIHPYLSVDNDAKKFVNYLYTPSVELTIDEVYDKFARILDKENDACCVGAAVKNQLSNAHATYKSKNQWRYSVEIHGGCLMIDIDKILPDSAYLPSKIYEIDVANQPLNVKEMALVFEDLAFQLQQIDLKTSYPRGLLSNTILFIENNRESTVPSLLITNNKKKTKEGQVVCDRILLIQDALKYLNGI